MTRRFFSRIRQCLRGPLNLSQQSTVLWGIWFLTMVAFFSVAGFFHRYYLSMLAPAIAAIVGIAFAVLWRAYCHRRPLGWLLPIALIATAVVQAKILTDYPAYAHWMTPLVLGGATVTAVGLLLARLRPVSILRRHMAVAAATAGLMVLLLAPTVWAGVSVRDANGGGIPAAGPQQQGQGFPGGGPGGNRDGMGSTSTSGLLAYLEANRGTTKFLVAVPSSQSADTIIIQTGEPVMAMGGFSGTDPILAAESVAQLVKDGTVRYFRLGGSGPGVGSIGSATAIAWVTSSCTAVPSSAYASSTTSTGRIGGFGSSQTLYDCAGTAATEG